MLESWLCIVTTTTFAAAFFAQQTLVDFEENNLFASEQLLCVVGKESTYLKLAYTLKMYIDWSNHHPHLVVELVLKNLVVYKKLFSNFALYIFETQKRWKFIWKPKPVLVCVEHCSQVMYQNCLCQFKKSLIFFKSRKWKLLWEWCCPNYKLLIVRESLIFFKWWKFLGS